MKGAVGEFVPGASSTFHYDSLPEFLKKPYMAIRKAMIADQYSVVIGKPLDMDTCGFLIESILNDNPQIFWLMNGCGVMISGKTTTIKLIRNRFSKDRERIKAEITNNAQAIYRKYIEGLKDAYSIELAVHDVLSKRVTYDGTDMESSHSLVGPMLDKRGVCDGISKANAFLLNAFGVDASVVTGKKRGSTENHAWNVVRIDREWYNEDVTFDLQEGSGVQTRFYLNMDDTLASRTHELKNAGRCKSRKQNHYVRNGTYFKRAEEAVRYISGMKPDSGSIEDVYDIYIEEDTRQSSIIPVIYRKYAGRAASYRMIMSNGRYMVIVRKGTNGQKGKVLQAVRNNGQKRSSREPGEASQRHVGHAVRRERRQSGMVSERGGTGSDARRHRRKNR